MTAKILQSENQILRQVSEKVSESELESAKFKKILRDMTDALNSQSDGLAIAGPQIGISKRVFIISGRIKSSDFMQGKDVDKDNVKYEKDMIFINPEIIKTSKKTLMRTGEGCLSVRWIYGTVKRFTNVTIKYLDENGHECKLQAGGMMGHIIQHEIDHLDGVLFIDKAKKIERIEPEKNYEK